MRDHIDDNTIGQWAVDCIPALKGQRRVMRHGPSMQPPTHLLTAPLSLSGVVCMMGSTYNGQFEPVERVDAVLEEIFPVSRLLCV